MSVVWIPRWSIDLKPKVNGNGSLTVNYRDISHDRHISGWIARTQDEPFEEEVDPSHYDHLRHHHHHLGPHPRHHPVHGRGIGEWIRWRLLFALLRGTVL